MPGQKELAIGAIASRGGMVLDETLVFKRGISDAQIRRIAHPDGISALTQNPTRSRWCELPEAAHRRRGLVPSTPVRIGDTGIRAIQR